MSGCVFRGTGNGPCTVRSSPQNHHVVRQQRIRRRFPYGAYREPDGSPWRRVDRHGLDPDLDVGVEQLSLARILADPRNLMRVCKGHHDRVTGAALYAAVPESVWEFAREFGFVAELENDLARRAA